MTVPNWYNYFVPSKHSRLTQGHLPAPNLYHKILSHDGQEAYCCYFDLDQDLLKNEYWTGDYDIEHDENGKEKKVKRYVYLPQNKKPEQDYYKPEITFTEYEGTCRPALGMVSFDFDDKVNPEKCLNDVKGFVEWLAVDDIAIFFSGSKGFHVMVPFGYFPNQAGTDLPNELREMAKLLKEKFPTLDTSIYNYNRKFRVPFTKHEKSGLYKSLIHRDHLDECLNNLDQYKTRYVRDFLSDIKPTIPREPLQQLVYFYESSKRKNYDLQKEKEKAGSKEKPSPFEAFDNKLCVKKMLESRCEDIGRNNACLRIVNDFYRTGKFREDAEKIVYAWADKCGFPHKEVKSIFTRVYDQNANYNFGCQDDCKATYCSAKCDIWRKLDPDKRPVTADMPATETHKIKSDFDGVSWLMQKIFGSVWDDKAVNFSLGSIVKQGAADLFYYKDNHWQYLDKSKEDILKVKLNSAANNKLPEKRLEAIFKLFIKYVPHVPEGVDLFSPKATAANFNDGTVHLIPIGNNEYKIEFREHNKEDFVTNKINASYGEFEKNPDARNEAFENWLFEFLEEDKDKFNLIQEMYGASLLPMFPQFFFLLGHSSTGKSTTMKILKKLHGNAEYICGVSPDKFNGFHMNSMIGKLINMVMDIKTNCKIDDDIVKQVDDMEPIRIERKRKDDVYATLPPLHIFGANKMPMTLEGYSGAMKRRVCVVNFDKVYSGPINKRIADDLFNANPQGVLNFAIHGLKRLVQQNQGNYTRTQKSTENVDQWTKTNDYIWQFLKEAEEEGIRTGNDVFQIVMKAGAKIKRSSLWHHYKRWQDDAVEQRNHIGKMRFLQLMQDANFRVRIVEGHRYFLDIGECSSENDQI